MCHRLSGISTCGLMAKGREMSTLFTVGTIYHFLFLYDNDNLPVLAAFVKVSTCKNVTFIELSVECESSFSSVLPVLVLLDIAVSHCYH